MKPLLIVVLLLGLSASLRAMGYSDSRVLSLAKMKALGVQIESSELPGPRNVRRIWVAVSVFPADKGNAFLSMNFSVLEKTPDADFASPDPIKSGVRDSKSWAKEVRGGSSPQPVFRFSVSDDELPNAYLVVHFHLPKKAEIPVFGTYYFLLRDLELISKPVLSSRARRSRAWRSRWFASSSGQSRTPRNDRF